ncbi:MAG: isoprenyl transferase [Bernardetiaceae bacterium]|nr:isoprenyl transferase [Bernardetiaceae bacterium]
MDEHTIDKTNIPQHIAVIMDGNGRWAKKQGLDRVFGHRNAIKAVKETTEGCIDLGIGYLTLYAFSTENWSRPKEEVNALMSLLVSTLRKEIHTLEKQGVRLSTIGDIESLPDSCQRELAEAIAQTSHNTKLQVTLALSYSGRAEITAAARMIAEQVKAGELQPEQIDQALFSCFLSTRNAPEPELLIRTSGEMRLSNFLLWQAAYSELVFLPVLWPDFRKKHLEEAILIYQKRERRFGKTGEQMATSAYQKFKNIFK